MNIINSRRIIRDTFATADRSQRRRRARRFVLWAVAPIAAALAPTAGAAVQLTGVTSGSASVSQNGSVTTIRTSNNAILNFSQFNIAKGSAVDFLQPSAASRVLDHVNSATPSIVNGSLLSNGTVYLINPAGVIFGPGATVDVNRFYVAGSHMSDQDFLGNVDHFSGVSGIVSNSGTIHANQVYLVGSQVINQGSIVSPNGVVAMLCGSDVIVSEPGSHVTATVVPVVQPNATGAAHTTDLRTSPMAAGDAYSLAIRHTGSIVAGNVVINGGGGLVQISGIIDASSATVGGTVSITGAEVDLLSASINASGPLGGGDVQIGGGPHGTGDLTHAQYVSLDSATTINADATSNGAGGSIILWSDSSTASSAALSARGGPLGGNGGYVETSGPTLEVSVAPNVGSPHGAPGTWVLDPLGITIVNVPVDQGTAAFTGQSTINNLTIENALVAGDNVLITTNQAGATTPTLIQTAGALISVNLTAPVSLTLQANADMTLSGGITATGAGALTVELDQLNSASNRIAIDTAPININGALKILGGNVTVASTSGLTATSVQISSGTATTGESLTTGTVTIDGPIDATTGNATFGGSSFSSNATGTITTAGGNVAITPTAGIVVGGVVGTAGGSFTAAGTGFENDATIGNGAGSGSNTFSVNTSTGAGVIDINGAITWLGAAAVTFEGGGPISLTSTNTITAGGALSLYTTASALTAVTLSGTISATGAFISDGGAFSLPSTGSLSALSVNINTANVTPDAKAVNNGTVTFSAPVSTTGGDLDIGGAVSFTTNTTASVSVTGGNVNISTPGVITIGQPILTNGGNFTATLGTSFTTTASGTLSTSGGSITLTTSAPDGVSIGAGISTGGGSFTVVGEAFTDTAAAGITDGGSATGAGSLTINTTSGSGAITISDPITWTGTASSNRFITLEALGSITIATGGSITSAGGAGTFLPVSLFSTGAGTSITLTGPVNISGDFVADGGNFTISAPLVSPVPNILTALSASINTTKNPTATPAITSTLTLGTVTIAGPILTAGGDVSIGGTISFIDNQHGTITTGGGAVIITNTGLLSIGQAISTSGGSLTATLGNDFTTAGSGTITTGGGNITVITSSSDGVSIGSNVNTGGGSFTVIGQSFEDTATITDGGVGTSAGSLTVNTTSGPVAAIAINSPISWAGGTGRFITLETSGAITIGSTGSITATAGTGALPVSLFTTGASSSITLTGAVDTTGAFVADGGNFVISLPSGTPVPTILTASTIAINTSSSPTATPALTSTLTLGTVSFAGPVLANATTGDAITVGGTVSFILNQSGGLTTKGGNIVISNTGLIAFGRPAITAGGNFTATTNIGFTTSNSGSINTGGGNVALVSTTTNGISIGNEVNTEGGSFFANSDGFQDTALIHDGGVGTSAGTLVINTANGTSDITNLNLSWTPGTGRSVLVEGAKNITINAIAATGTAAMPVSLYTTSSTDTITLNGPVTASGVVISSGGNFTIAAAGSLTGNTINIGTASTTPDSRPLISSAVTFGGAVVSHGTITVSATAFDVPSGGSINSNGALINVNASGVVTLEGPITSLGGEVAISSGATLTSDSTGTITSSGGNVSLGGATGVSIGANVNTGGGNFTSSGETFTNTVTISDGGVDDSQAQGLAITTTGGDLTISGDINWAASHSPMTFTIPSANFIQLSGTIEANPAQPLSFVADPIVVSGSGSPTISGGAISFGALLPSASGSPTALTIFSTAAVSLQQVGANGTPFGGLTVTSNSTTELPVTTLHGNVFSGNLDFAGTVVLPANVQLALTGGGIVEFDGPIEGPGGLTVVMPNNNANGSLNIPNEIRFNGNIGDGTPLAFVNLFPEASGIVGFQFGKNLNPPNVQEQQPLTTVNIASGGAFEIDNVSPPPKNFTISLSTIDSYGPLSITIGSSSTPNARNLYAVGQNEKLSVYGNLSINTNGGTITTGDLSTIGNMTLNASRVNFLLRASTLNDAGTALLDTGVDLIAGGEMTLPGGAVFTAVSGPLVPGAFDVPGFIAQSYAPSSDIGVVSSEMKTAYSIVGGIPASVLFSSSGLLLDLTPNTLTTTVPFFVPPIPSVFDYPISGANPREQIVAGTVPLDFKEAFPPATPGPIVQQELKDDGLFTRDPSVEEILGATMTMAVYDDMPNRPRPRSADYRVVSTRLNSASAGAFIRSYNQVFGSDPQAKRTQIAASIQAAWDAYVTQNADQTINGAGFAKYCATTPSASDAGADLAQLRGLRADIGTLGLSFKEAQIAFQYNILTGLSAIGMREGDLASALAASPGTH